MYYVGADAIQKNKHLDDGQKYKLLQIYINEMKNIHLGQN